MIDFEKPSQHIKFVESVDEIKGPVNFKTNHNQEEIEEQMREGGRAAGLGAKVSISREKKAQYLQEIRTAQSENKKQYKKLADALVKEEQLRRVGEALTLDKMLK